MSTQPQIRLLLIAAAGALLLIACGGNGDTADAPASPTSPSGTPAARRPIAPPTFCQVIVPAGPALNLEVSARWKGSDRIIVEGSVDLPETATLQAWICQDGQMTVALSPKGEPEIKKGKVKAEWELQDVEVGPVFDPDARFEATLAAQSEIGLPFFVIRIPVEGRPE